MKILIVEDEIHLAEALQQILMKNRYAADLEHNGISGLDQAMTGLYDVIILDIMLPKMNGLEVLRQHRKAGISTPVLLLTARDEASDKVNGLDCGADDYLTKPFNTEELLARIRALGRRCGVPISDDVLKFGGIYLAMMKGGDQQVNRLLEDLARREGQMPGRNLRPDVPFGERNDGSIQSPPAESPLEKPVTADPALPDILGGVPSITASDIALIRNSFSVRLGRASSWGGQDKTPVINLNVAGKPVK